MKKIMYTVLVAAAFAISCGDAATEAGSTESAEAAPLVGQSAVQDDESQKDVVKVAAASPDHTTLVAAVKKAELVDALSNAGPFTVFAPTNAAFDKVPKESLDNLLKPENKEQLQDILQYHVFVGILKPEQLLDGQTYGQVNGGNITVSNKEGKIRINNSANVVATIPASNGIIHVVDAVLLPPSK